MEKQIPYGLNREFSFRTTVMVVLVLLVFSSLFVPVNAQDELKFEGKHFSVYCPSSYPSGREILDFMENHYKFFAELFLYDMPRISVYVKTGLDVAGRAYSTEYKMEIDARSWTTSPIRATLLHELTHVWQGTGGGRYGGRSWFNEGFATLIPIVIFNMTGNTQDMEMYAGIVSKERSFNITDRAYAYRILYSYTRSFGVGWIMRFLRYLKEDSSNLRTDTNIVAYLSAANGRDLSDDYIKEGLTIDKSTVAAVMKRWSGSQTSTQTTATTTTSMTTAVTVTTITTAATSTTMATPMTATAEIVQGYMIAVILIALGLAGAVVVLVRKRRSQRSWIALLKLAPCIPLSSLLAK